MKTYIGVSHFTLDFRSRNKSRNGVDNDQVNCRTANESLCDFKTLLTAVRLGNEKGVNIYAKRTSIYRIKRMLSIDKCSNTACLLNFSCNVERNRSLTGRFRTVDLNDSALRNAADTERNVKTYGTCRDIFHLHICIVAQTHDSAFTVVLFDFCQCIAECFFAVIRNFIYYLLIFL